VVDSDVGVAATVLEVQRAVRFLEGSTIDVGRRGWIGRRGWTGKPLRPLPPSALPAHPALPTLPVSAELICAIYLRPTTILNPRFVRFNITVDF
jgi:hypothetical protein